MEQLRGEKPLMDVGGGHSSHLRHHILASIHGSIGASFLLALSNNCALERPMFIAFFSALCNDLGHEQKIRSSQAPRHVKLGPETAVEVEVQVGVREFDALLGGALRPRLGLAWPG